MTIHHKQILISIPLAFIVFMVLITVVPPLLNVDHYRPRVIAYLDRVSGKKSEIGHLTVTLFPEVTIRIDDLRLKNPAEFPEGYFVTVKRIDAELQGRALLHRQVIIKKLVMENPVINLTSDPDGPWNFENPNSSVAGNIFSFGVISKVEIKNGQLVVSNLLPSDEPGVTFFEAHDISGTLNQVDLRAFTNPDVSATSPVFVGAEGNLQAAALRFGSIYAGAVSSNVRLQARDVFFTGVHAQAYGGNAAGDLSFNLAGKNPNFETHAQIQNIDVADLLAAFPSGRVKMTGKMEGQVKLAGEITHSERPLLGIHGAGRVIVRNGQVPSLRLNANLIQLVHSVDLGPARNDPSSFSFISADWQLADQRIFSRTIDIDGRGVDVDGSGSVSIDGSDRLDYQGTAKILKEQGFFTNLFARFAGATVKDGKLMFHFRITGTIDHPVFTKGNKKPE